jgi:flavin-dependent dehydrogenase
VSSDDVLVVGAGPAGAVAAIVLARAGVRVRLIDRATFPRDKLCGDTINPGTLALLRRLRLAAPLERGALRVEGMRVTGEGGVVVDGRYPDGRHGLALSRRDLDAVLVDQAVAAGAVFDAGVVVREAVVDERRGKPVVRGVVVAGNGRAARLEAPVVIAADGRRSAIAFGLRLAGHPARPRRWAIGAYFETPGPDARFGEMHIRRDRYIGVAPLGGGIANVCVVTPLGRPGEACALGNPMALLRRAIDREPVLRDRFGGREPVRAPIVLGPLAIDSNGGGLDGLVLAGDAAGFVDPMTGDGLRFAVRGGELAASAALAALDRGWDGVHERLAIARRQEFEPKWRFNRALRATVASPAAVRAAAFGARLAPAVVRYLIARAGDCDIRDPGGDRVWS